MKILQVIPYFNPKKGGDVAVVYNLSKYLAQRDHDVTIITTDSEFDEKYASSLENVNVIPFKCLINFNKFLFSPGMEKWLKKELKYFDIVHLHNFRCYQHVVTCKYAIKYNIPYIVQAHGALPIIIEKKGLKKLFDMIWGNKILINSAKYIAVSNVEIQQYKNNHLKEEKIVLIPNGIDTKKFENLPAKGNFRKKFDIKDKHLILFLGRIHKIKGIDFLVETFAELRNEVNDCVLVIAGPDDGYKFELEKLIKKLNLTNNVILTGHIDNPIEAYIDADVLVYPPIYEIFGLVPFEAIMCGTPVIVTDDCGCGELARDANCGYLVKYGDIEDLKENMKLIIENLEIRKERDRKGRKYIEENLAWNGIVKKVETVYEDCIRNV